MRGRVRGVLSFVLTLCMATSSLAPVGEALASQADVPPLVVEDDDADGADAIEVVDPQGDTLPAPAIEGPRAPLVVMDDGSETVSYRDLKDDDASASCVIVYDGTKVLHTGWYAVTTNVKIEDEVEVLGNANLILTDGHTLDVTNIKVSAGNSLTIWGQADGSGTVVAVADRDTKAGIGGSDSDCGDITINGGTVRATGGSLNQAFSVGSSGIGGCVGKRPGNITINGGTVEAHGKWVSPGIGSGGQTDIQSQEYSGGTITITGGTVSAYAENMLYSNSAAIGGGLRRGAGTITITGGTVNAYGYGTVGTNNDRGGAGIGSGYGDVLEGYEGGSIIITGGTINAFGTPNMAAAIGGGPELGVDSITITGGVINASEGVVGIGNPEGCHKVCKTTLGWTKESVGSMSVTASSYAGTVGLLRNFKDGDTTFAETESIGDLGSLAGRTLVPDPATQKHEVTFEAGTEGSLGAIAGSEVTYDESFELPPCAFQAKGKSFTGWWTVKVGDEAPYERQPGAFITVTDDTVVTATWQDEDDVSYRKLDGSDASVACYPVDAHVKTLSGDWYALTENVTIKDELTVIGDVNLILTDNHTLNVENVKVADGNSLTIWGQGKGSGTLFAESKHDVSAAIGGSDSDCGAITICGGTVMAWAGDSALGSAGIGGSLGRKAGTITICGGTVEARGAGGSAGIGSASLHTGTLDYDSGKVTIKGGVIDAYSGANPGYAAAAIGGGYKRHAGTIEIEGGMVRAHGNDTYNGAGIGCGAGSESDSIRGGSVTISGGTVYANGKEGYSAAIGGNYHCDIDAITIAGGVVEATIGKVGIGNLDGSTCATTLTWDDESANTMSVVAKSYTPNLRVARPFLHKGYHTRTDVTDSVTDLDALVGITLVPDTQAEMTIRFEAGDEGATGSMEAAQAAYRSEFTLPPCGYQVAGKRFNGWSVRVGASDPVFKQAGESVTVTDSVVATANWEVQAEVAYRDLTGVDVNVTCSLLDGRATVITGDWYAVGDSVKIAHEIEVRGNVNLILVDGLTLELPNIKVADGNSLTIWGQEGSGTLVATSGDAQRAGIGGSGSACGTIEINGGTIWATGGGGETLGSAGIGGAYNQEAGTVTINGGMVVAMGGACAAAIGSGARSVSADCSHKGGTVTITGGDVTARAPKTNPAGNDCFGAAIGGGARRTSGDITISGGTVVAENENGTAIGAGCGHQTGDEFWIVLTGGTIAITGGTVTARGGGADNINTPAAIGNASHCEGQQISITGGVVTATGGKVAVGNADGTPESCTTTLGWAAGTAQGMSVTADSYGGTVTLAKAFKDRESTAVYLPTENFADLGALAGRMLLPYTLSEPVFRTRSLVLSGQIGVDIYVELDMLTEEERQGCYMTFDVARSPQSRDDFDPADKNHDGFYCFTAHVNAVQMADTITATLHYGDGRTVSKETSVVDYVQAAREDPQTYGQHLVDLAGALVNYGHYVQPQLATENGWKVGIDHAAIDNVREFGPGDVDEAIAGTADSAFTKEMEGCAIDDMKCLLVLDSSTRVDIYLTPKGNTVVTATLDDGTDNVAVRQTDGRYRVSVNNIAAHMLDVKHTLHVQAGGAGTITFSALSYPRAVLASQDASDDAKRAMTSLWRYHQATVSYLKQEGKL